MLNSSMGPQYDGSTGAGMQQQPLSAPPVRNRNISGSSTNSLPTNTADTAFPFHLISQFGDVTNNAVLNSALLALGQQQQMLGHQKPQQPQFKLDRSVSEPNAQNQQKLHPSQGIHVVNPSRYKTEVCRPFNENGFCKYGDKCQFAHGDQDLRGLPRHPKYKTELCRTFHTIGFCPYGPRCHFIHSEDEYKLVEISQMKQNQAAQQAANEMAQQAANLQVQHQAIQAQLKALVSQFNQNQLVTQHGSQPRSCDRPKLLQSISVHPLMRDNLGSAGDTPPESMSGSPPVLSPVFTDDTVSDILSDSLSSVSGFVTPPICGDLNSSFNFSTSAGESSPLQMSPVKQQQQQRLLNQQQIGLENVTATFQRMSLNKGDHHHQQQQPAVFSPPSSPDNNSDSDQSRCRLPVFSKLGR